MSSLAVSAGEQRRVTLGAPTRIATKLGIGTERHEAACRALVMAAAATLFLHDAATVGVSYTLRISYAIMVIAAVVGAPFVVRGWRSAPPGVVLATGFLVLVYLCAGALDVNPVVIVAGGRASHTRWIVYILDLGVGVVSVGLVLGLFRTRRQVRQLVVALAAGATVAALYGIYQWFAQHYGGPLSNVDNAPNSDNFTTGARFQGLGLLGWERVRGTFVEPFALGIYLAAMFPLVAVAGAGRSRRGKLLGVAAMLSVSAALVVTDSSLAWASLVLAVTVAATGAAIAVGRPVFAGAAAALAALGAVLCIVTLAQPSVLSNVTARSQDQLRQTVTARTGAWGESSEVWAHRPVLGYGPGASSVKLARVDTAVGVTSAPTVLGSAYGIWAASLIDAGVFGVLAWVALFAVVLLHVARAAVASTSKLIWATFAAALAGILSSQVGGDRLDLRVWILMALALAAASLTRRPRNRVDMDDA
jgi:hypothetical protein